MAGIKAISGMVSTGSSVSTLGKSRSSPSGWRKGRGLEHVLLRDADIYPAGVITNHRNNCRSQSDHQKCNY